MEGGNRPRPSLIPLLHLLPKTKQFQALIIFLAVDIAAVAGVICLQYVQLVLKTDVLQRAQTGIVSLS